MTNVGCSIHETLEQINRTADAYERQTGHRPNGVRMSRGLYEQLQSQQFNPLEHLVSAETLEYEERQRLINSVPRITLGISKRGRL